MSKCFRLSASQKQYIESIKTNGTLVGDEWAKKKNDMQMISLKEDIRRKLRLIQKGDCAYCGNKYHATSEDHIEHIAPKASNRHPEFMFEEHNLVLSCQYCNGFIKKGTKNTVSSKSRLYKKCLFNIVHPYFDKPEDHYEYIDNSTKVLIAHKTPQGKASIKMFKLDEKQQSVERAKDAIYKDYVLKPAEERLVDLVGMYRLS